MAEKRIKNQYGLEGNGTTSLKIVLDSGTPYGELAHVGGTSAVLELHIDMWDFAPGTGDDKDYSAGYIIVKYLSSKLNTSNNMSNLMTAIKGDAS